MSNKNLIEYQEAPLRRVCVSGNAAENIEDDRERERERERERRGTDEPARWRQSDWKSGSVEWTSCNRSQINEIGCPLPPRSRTRLSCNLPLRRLTAERHNFAGAINPITITMLPMM